MNKLYVFGDSFTKGCGCLIDDEYSIKYKRSDDKIWCEIISEKLNMDLINHGVGLNSNDKIIDSIIKEFDLFDDSDVILIQKTFSHRFDIPDIENRLLITISPTQENLIDFHSKNYTKNYTKNEIAHINYISILFDSNLYVERQNLRFDFLKKMIESKKVKCLIWNINDYFHIDRIIDSTKGEINDFHWSFDGHKEVANDFYKIINSL